MLGPAVGAAVARADSVNNTTRKSCKATKPGLAAPDAPLRSTGRWALLGPAVGAAGAKAAWAIRLGEASGPGLAALAAPSRVTGRSAVLGPAVGRAPRHPPCSDGGGSGRILAKKRFSDRTYKGDSMDKNKWPNTVVL